MQIRACFYPFVLFVFFSALISLPFAHAADSSKMKTIAPEELVRILNAREPKPTCARPILRHETAALAAARQNHPQLWAEAKLEAA